MSRIEGHTPGPWRVGGHPRDNSGTAWREILTDSLPFAPSYVCQAQGRDATLIAAAPDLLAALQGALRFMETVEGGMAPGQHMPEAHAARAAIAKATGQEPGP